MFSAPPTRLLLWSLALVLLVLMIAPGVATACPTCKDGIANGSSHSNMVRGYQMSIIFMMTMPFLILGGLGTYFYLEIRKARALQLARNVPAGDTQWLPQNGPSKAAAHRRS